MFSATVSASTENVIGVTGPLQNSSAIRRVQITKVLDRGG